MKILRAPKRCAVAKRAIIMDPN